MWIFRWMVDKIWGEDDETPRLAETLIEYCDCCVGVGRYVSSGGYDHQCPWCFGEGVICSKCQQPEKICGCGS